MGTERARVRIACAGLFALAAACTNPCKEGTVLINVTMTGAAVSADSLRVRMTTAGSAEQPVTKLDLSSNVVTGSIEVDFTRYPLGEVMTFDVVATHAGIVVGGGTATTTLAPGCDVVAVQIDGIDASSYAGAVLADAPLAYYRLSEKNGAMLARDSSGNFLDVPYYGPSDVLERAGIPGGGPDTALTVTDPTGAIRVHDERIGFFGNAPFSLEAWVGLGGTSVPSSHVVFDMPLSPSSAALGGYALYMDNSNLVFLVRRLDPNTIMATNQFAPVGSDYFHLVGTYDGATLQLYVNAMPSTAVPSTGPLVPVDPTSIPTLFFGSGAMGEAGTALIDEVAIYDKALTPAQVAVHYGRGR